MRRKPRLLNKLLTIWFRIRELSQRRRPRRRKPRVMLSQLLKALLLLPQLKQLPLPRLPPLLKKPSLLKKRRCSSKISRLMRDP